MNKKLLFIMFLTILIIFTTGCSQSVSDSEKFEGIPIFPEDDRIYWVEDGTKLKEIIDLNIAETSF
jgi:Na+-transporting methylmalonyl-CoA/oxaloacetate decarboxylase gamma subunit